MEVRVGDLVEVRSKSEILALLDRDGKTGGLPFMPEMFEFCGEQFRVFKSAHKTCDTIERTGSLSMPDAVHLEGLRCSGAAHGGCQAACLLFWKTTWLKRVSGSKGDEAAPQPSTTTTEDDVVRAILAPGSIESEPRYRCQATELLKCTRPLPVWKLNQYVQDVTSGNVTLPELLRTLSYVAFCAIGRPNSRGWGDVSRWLYNRFQALRGGISFPIIIRAAGATSSSPADEPNLQPGDLVRVKSHRQIASTLNKKGGNRGLWFDREMVPFCGRIFRVKLRVERFIEEATGRMTRLKTPAVILEGVWCRAHYSKNRLFCPRSIYPWWREKWLERVPEEAASSAEACPLSSDERSRGR